VKKFLLSFLSVVLLTVFVLAPTAVFAAGEENARDPQRVLARVEDYEIREEHIDQIIAQLVASAGPQAAMMHNNDAGRRMILDDFIASRLFTLSAKSQGLQESQEFQDLLESFTTHALSRMAMENALEGITVSDEDLRNFYDENPDQFTMPEQIRASHILIPSDEEAEAKLALIQEQLARGVSFAELAMEHSTCPSGQTGGSLGQFGRGQMVPEFEEVAFALNEPGDISEPIESRFGWHIILLDERTPASLVAFEDVVREAAVLHQLEEYLLNEKRTQKYQEVLAALREQFTVEILVDEPEE